MGENNGIYGISKNDINSRYPRIQENFMASLSTFTKRYHLGF